jgi:anaerobic selenocysteine-containing dehydrogenase
VAGLSSTFGYGATTNSWADLDKAGTVLIAGANAADNHPAAMRQVLAARAAGAKVVVVDPRRTATAAQADVFAQLRPGSDIALLGAVINIILKKELFDREYVTRRTNARYAVNPGYDFTDGLFAGYDAAAGSYDISRWAYRLDGGGRPAMAADIDAPGTVFSHLRGHFSRYEAATAADITGVPAATIEELAAAVAGRRPLAILYALGITQHTTAVQTIRCYAILSLLLGAVGVAGGGVNALRGEANVQGSTDLGGLATSLPGYLPAPAHGEETLTDYAARHGTEAAGDLAALLAAWFAGSPDECYRWLPRRGADKPATYLPMLAAMAAGQFKAALAVGINPLTGTPDNRLATQALAALDTLAVVDLFPSETAEFWRLPGVRPAAVKTEVLFLPAAHFYEKDGSLTSGSRLVQRQQQLLRPAGLARPDLAIIDRLFRAVRSLYAASRAAQDAPLLAARWDYGRPADAKKVLAEIGRACRLYAGAAEALAAGRTFAWPHNQSILYEDGVFATAEGTARLFAAPYASRRKGEAAPARVAAVCLDGPLPEHYEPAESPLANALHPAVNATPLLRAPATGGKAVFPYVLTTYAAPAGDETAVTVEVSAALADELGLADGDKAAVASARGETHATVRVSGALRPLTAGGRTVHTVAMPLGRAASALGANAVTSAAADPTAGTPTAKTCLVDIRKAR